jgi:TP901 family phage tail tape measure protein
VADRSVIVRLKAEVSGFQAAMAASGASVQKMQADLEKMKAAGGSSLGAAATAAAGAREELIKVGAAAQQTAQGFGLAYDKSGTLRNGFGHIVTDAKAASLGLVQASDATREFAAEQAILAAETSNGTAMGRLTASVDANKQAWTASGMALLGFGAAALAGVGLAVKAFSEFGAKMAQVQSLSHASAAEMQTLTDAALHMGESIGFSATEVADAEIELVKAGISVKDIMGGALVGSLTLAAAGQISVADATEIATIAMTQFGLAGKDIPHVADLLAAGADKALGGVSELGWALKTGGLVAHQFGMSLDDTVGTLALFAQNGLMGEAAGTDLRQMLLKLAAPSKTASADMEKLGMTLYDSQGHFVGITSLAGQLHDKMQNLSESERNAMEAHIFGARSIVGANILYQAGAKGVQGWIDAVNDSGFAAKQAAGKMDSMSGDVKKLQAAWQTSMIEMGSTSDSFVRPVIQGVTQVIQGFEKLPEPVKGAILGFGAVVGVAALLGGAFLTITPKVLDVISGFKQLQADGSKVASTFGSIAKYAGIAAAAIALANAAAMAMTAGDAKAQSADASAQALMKLSKAGESTAKVFSQDFFKNANGFQIGGFEKDINGVGDALHKLNNPSAYDHFNDFASSILPAGDYQMKEVRTSIANIDGAMTNFATSGSMDIAAQGFRQIAAEGAKQGVSLKQTADSFPQYINALRQQATQAKVTLSDQELLDWAMGKVPAQMAAATASYGTYQDALGASQAVTADMSKALAAVGLSADGTVLSMDKLISSFAQAGLISLSADGAAIAYHKALDDLTASVAKNGSTLDINTEAGRANRTALDAIASSGLAVVQANAKNNDSQQSLTKNMHETYDALINGAAQFGITGDAADTLARKALGIPKGIKIDSAIQNYIDTMLKMEGIGSEADKLNGKTVDLWVNTHNNTIYSDTHVSSGVGGGGGQSKFAIGGAVMGAGSGTSDEVPALLSNGEHVLTADEVQKMGGQNAVYRFRQLVDKGEVPKFAKGGAVYYNSPGHMHESASAHANRLYREAQARTKAAAAAKAKAAKARAKELAKSATYRSGELNTLALDDARGQSYGTVNQSLSQGYAFSDRLRGVAASGNLPSQVGFLNATANQADATLRSLWAQSDRLGKSLTVAQTRLTDLTNVKTAVSSSLRGEFKLSDVISNTSMFGVPNIADVQAAASAKLHKIQAFGVKLKALQKMGYSGAIVQEVAGMGSEQGAVAADALIGASNAQVTTLNGTYTAMDSASDAAGIYVTNSMFKGGVAVAQGIVSGLQSQESAITKAMTQVGLSMEKALKKALGINSPSRVATDITDNFTGTIIDRQKAALGPIGAHATAMGHAMTPSKSLLGGSGSTAYRPSAPSYQGAPSYQAAAASRPSVTIINHITGQSNPVATAHEVTRRQTALAV